MLLVAFCLLSSGKWSGAQTNTPPTRADALHAERAAKAQALAPHHPNALESGLNFFEDRAVFILDREGFYPKLGSITVGSGFAYGLGFRDRDLLNNYGAVDMWVAGSTRGYFAAEGRVRFPELAHKRLLVEGWAGRRDYAGEYFYGLGTDSQRADQSDYGLRTTVFGGSAGVRPFSKLIVGGSLEYLHPSVGRGNDDSVPDVEDAFGEAEAPGVSQRADFLRTHGYVELDYRQPRYPRQGGFVRADVSHYEDRTTGSYTFNRYDFDVRQFVGFFAGRRVLGLRGFVSTTDEREGGVVPFYGMPTLGGNDTLRGFRMYRFRGPHALLLQAEYRWEIWSGLDGALFYDAGKTPLERSDLNFDGLERDYGFGFRFNTDNGIIFRADAGFGSRDGPHLYLVWGGVF
ncbi:MAG TPA: hypothetical protein VL263_03805 [Vicinamibacterales bacterium]|nr:hypothetical protein [Vicinamibacterales bacterium]